MGAVHVPASDKFSARRDADLINGAIGPDRRSQSMGAVIIVIAWRGRIESADASLTVNAVVPVVIVTGVDAVPAAVLISQGRVIPHHAGVLTADDHSLSREAERPDFRRADVINSCLD